MEKMLQTDELQFQVSGFEFVISTPELDIHSTLEKIFKETQNERFLLKGTGFSMHTQIERWINKQRNAIETNSSLEEARKQFISETIQDIIGFYHEYLSGQDIFPIDVEISQNQKGQKIVFANKYNSELQDITSSKERDGALLRGINRVVEILKDEVSENSVVVLLSPKGWSGWEIDGKEVVYPDNQAYVYYIDQDGDLNSITIRTDMTLDQSERMAKISPKNPDTKERIKNVVSTPIVINDGNFETVLEKIEEVTGKRFDKIRSEIRNRKQLFDLNEDAKTLIDNLEARLLTNVFNLNEEDIKTFVIEVGKTIIELGSLTLPDSDDTVNSTTVYLSESGYKDRFDKILYQIQQIPGCNGGGFVQNSLAAGLFGTNKISVSGEKYVKKCGVCQTTIEAYISKGYRCTNCQQVYEGC